MFLNYLRNCFISVHNVMLRRINFYSICFAFGLSVLLILAGSRYADNTYYIYKIKNFVKVEDGEEGSMLPIPTNSYDGSPNIEKILEETKAKVKSELIKYNFTHSGIEGLEDLLMESGGTPIRSLIISTWRSGTTFLGELLNAIPCTFPVFEPLISYGIIQIRGPPLADKALTTMKDMFKCSFEGKDDYFEFGRNHDYVFSRNKMLWDHCKYNKEMCLDADFISKFCKLLPFQIIKEVHVRLHLIQEILEDNELNIKVVLLIRDPRGVMQSRQHTEFCQWGPDCWKPELLCADMISDYVAAERLLPKYPDRLMVQRYEELALKPNITTHRILKFLKLSATSPSVEEFLQSHTNVEEADNAFSTYRVSRDVPFKWKKMLDYNYVDRIQSVCKEAMDLWGYRLAHNASYMTSQHFNPLADYTIRP